MKKIYILLIICISCFANAQNYTISMYDTVKYGNPTDLLLPTVTFSNSTNAPIQMHFHRILKNIPSGWTSCFCAPTCIAQTQDDLDFTIPVAGGSNHIGSSTQDVSPNFGTDTIPGMGEVIVVFNEIGFTNYDTIIFRGFTTSPTGIKNYEKEAFLIFPNPTSDFISIKNFDKQINTFQLFDVNGKEVLKNSYQITGNEIKVNILDLPTGQYFLMIQCYDNFVYKKKIIKV